MNRRRNTWIIVIVVCLLLCCCATAVAGVVGAILGLVPWRWAGNLDIDSIRAGGIGVEATTEVDRQEFAVERDSALELSCPVCDVQILAGEASAIAIEGSLHAWGYDREAAESLLDDLDVSLSQEGGRVIVSVDMPREGWGTTWRGRRGARVDLEIAVPQQTDLDLDVDVGTVQVEGTEGPVDVRLDVGDLLLSDVVARDEFSVRTDVARVRFEGSLGEGMRYNIRSGVGEIALSLPADSSFEIDAESNVGAVTSDFAVSGTADRQTLIGGRMKGTVGDAPTAELVLRSEIGAIQVNKD